MIMTTTTHTDRLLTRQEVSALLGSKCATGHVIRAYARKGLIRAVKFNARCYRYSEASVHAFINGRKAA